MPAVCCRLRVSRGPAAKATKTTLLAAVLALCSAICALAGTDTEAQTPDYNNWTTESLKLIFIPTAHIAYARGKIKTVTFPFRPDATIYALQLFHLIFMFLLGPTEEANPHMHNLQDGDIPGGIAMKDPETGYVVTRDRDPHAGWRYHFTVTKNGTTILTAELIESEEIGPRFILHIN